MKLFILILTIYLLNFIICQDELNTYMIKEHNKLRKSVDPPALNEIPDLVYDENLKKTAEFFVSACVFDHSDQGERREKYKEFSGEDIDVGENIAANAGQDNPIEVAMDGWGVEEKPYYDYESNKCIGEECRHYTQIIWANTLRIGCAQKLCPDSWTYIFCNYAPAGNYKGERPYIADPNPDKDSTDDSDDTDPIDDTDTDPSDDADTDPSDDTDTDPSDDSITEPTQSSSLKNNFTLFNNIGMISLLLSIFIIF